MGAETSPRRPVRRVAGDRGATTARSATGAPRTGALDPLVHEQARLGILSALAAGPGVLTFVELKAALDLTDGNLSVHARRLEDAGYVECRKGFDGRVPRTEYRLTPRGRRALATYLDHMEALIRAARGTT